MPRQRRILIVSQDDSLLDNWKTELGNKFHVTHAPNITDAEEILAESPEFATIVIESFEHSGTLHALPFIENLRRKFRKPIIGLAAKYTHQQQMILAGCNVYAIHHNVPNKICEALNLITSSPKVKKPRKEKKSWRKTRKKNPDPAV